MSLNAGAVMGKKNSVTAGLGIQIGVRVPADVAAEIDAEVERLESALLMEIPRAAVALSLIREALEARKRKGVKGLPK